MNIPERVRITEKTLHKFYAKPFSWGDTDCLRLARFHLVGFGHSLPRIPRYNGALSAMRQLKAQGVDSVEGLLSKYLAGAEIPHSMMLPGDLATVRSDDPISAIIVSVGNGKFMGWAKEAVGLRVVSVLPERAWRV